MPSVDHCICVLRDALCFTSVIQSWGPKASPLIIQYNLTILLLRPWRHGHVQASIGFLAIGTVRLSACL